MRREFPILEHDADTEALIDPQKLKKPNEDVPERGVICFFQDVIDRLREEGTLEEVVSLRSEMGRHPVYRHKGMARPVAVFHPGVGAPLAAGLLDEVIALGCRKFIACGGAGVLDSSIRVGHLLVPASAVRDEGTSYHYLPPAREVSASPAAVAAIEATLRRERVAYRRTKTWTTDGIYRETPGKVTLRRSEGCECVEMEAAALFAVAQHRNVELAQILYGGDDLGGEHWSSRNWQDRRTIREELVSLAAKACLALDAHG